MNAKQTEIGRPKLGIKKIQLYIGSESDTGNKSDRMNTNILM